jgi:hypothetical protein
MISLLQSFYIYDYIGMINLLKALQFGALALCISVKLVGSDILIHFKTLHLFFVTVFLPLFVPFELLLSARSRKFDPF